MLNDFGSVELQNLYQQLRKNFPFAEVTTDANGNILAITTGPTGGTALPINPPVNFRNVIDGGDFTVNPFQRNIPGLASAGVIAAAITSTVTYFADRFFAVGGASSSILMAVAADTSLPGFSQSLKLSRSVGNANTAVINFGQVVETLDTVRLQGQTVTLSFWVKPGANFSGTGMNVQLVTGTGTNQSAASLVAGTWTIQTNIVNATLAYAGVPIGTQGIVPGSGLTRVQFTAVVPATATQIAMLLSYTPVGTAGADDSLTFQGFQLEQSPFATPFEHRDIQVELEICQRYSWVMAEPAAGVVLGSGMNTSTAAQAIYMATPVQLRAAPTVTVAAGTFKTNQAGVATATTITAGTTHTPNAISVNGNSSAVTAGDATLLIGGGGSGWIMASADF